MSSPLSEVQEEEELERPCTTELQLCWLDEYGRCVVDQCRPHISFHAVGTCHQTKLARSLFSESCHVWMTAVLWQVVLIFLTQLSPGMVEEEIVTDALSSGFSYLHRMARIIVLACRSLSEILETLCTEKPTNQVVFYNLNLEMGQSCFKVLKIALTKSSLPQWPLWLCWHDVAVYLRYVLVREERGNDMPVRLLSF